MAWSIYCGNLEQLKAAVGRKPATLLQQEWQWPHQFADANDFRCNSPEFCASRGSCSVTKKDYRTLMASQRKVRELYQFVPTWLKNKATPKPKPCRFRKLIKMCSFSHGSLFPQCLAIFGRSSWAPVPWNRSFAACLQPPNSRRPVRSSERVEGRPLRKLPSPGQNQELQYAMESNTEWCHQPGGE